MTAADSWKTTVRRRTVLAAAVAVIGLAGAANAFADPDPVDLTVVDRQTGEPLRIWRHDGRLFVAGQPGARYSLRVTNHTDGRVLVVMSVDGVNILTGETAGYDQRGYVFGAYESYDLNGWRKSLSEVADFTFAPLPQSYAARTGRPGDVGVIGMAVFSERAAVAEAPAGPDWRDQSDRNSSADAFAARRAMPAPAAAPPPPSRFEAPPSPIAAAPRSASSVVGGASAERLDDKLGTAHGARERSVTTLVAFERETAYPQFIRQIEYDTYDHLVASGVIPEQHRPQPFPSNPDGAGFVPDPPDEP